MSGRSGWSQRVVFALAVLLQLVVLYIPSTGVDPPLTGIDKVVHVGIFALVAWTGRRAGVPLRWLVPMLVAHAVLSEFVQWQLLPHRSGDPWDALADSVGVCVGSVLPTRRRARMMES